MGYLDETGLSRVWNRIKAYIQSLNYTSNIGTVTGITMNNTSYSPVNGDVDIGTVVTTETEPAYTQSAAATLTSSNIVKGVSQSYNIWSGTQVEYDAIATKDNNTLYFIKES